MAALSHQRLSALLEPFFPEPAPLLLEQLSVYLDLLLLWNARTNLTAIREPEAIVQTHFGESLFVARNLPAGETLLDLGSGAGFPGLPIQLAHPALKVTLAESQSKKASFLREVVRTLKLPTEVWGARVEAMPAARRFDIVTLRAVDDPSLALRLAGDRVTPEGQILHLTTHPGSTPSSLAVPLSHSRVLSFLSSNVPRGT
jgi:16S rRNA (guanine527-N7)-methyltransferase